MTKLGTLSAVVATAFFLGGSAQQHEAEAAHDSWGCFPDFVICDGNGGINVAWNGTVGLPFRWNLQAICSTGQWSLEGVEIQTGRLPPGLDLDPAGPPTKIIGVPTRAGSFSFQVLVRGANCEGDTRADFTTNYTIVVTGS